MAGSGDVTTTERRRQSNGTWRIVLAWVLVACWAAVIFAASAHTGNDLDSGSDLLGRVKNALGAALSSLAGHEVDPSPIGHASEYLVFGALIAHALRRSAHVPTLRGRLVMAACAIASAYGVTDEFHQLFVPGRACDWHDWLVDTIAALVGALVVWALRRRRHGHAPRA